MNLCVILSPRRTGSNLLKRLLVSTSYAKPINLVDNLFEKLKTIESCPTFYVGKIELHDLPRFANIFQNKIQKPLSDFKWICLRRENLVRQAISDIKRDKLGFSHDWEWSDKTPPCEDNFDIHDSELEKNIIEQVLSRLILLNFLKDNNLDYLDLTYEDFSQRHQWDMIVESVYKHLGINYDLPLNVSADLKPTTTSFNDEVYARYVFNRLGIMKTMYKDVSAVKDGVFKIDESLLR